MTSTSQAETKAVEEYLCTYIVVRHLHSHIALFHTNKYGTFK